MKLDKIDIRNVMGVRGIEVDLTTPITIFAGGNGAGKSSALECVRMALGENPLRVSLKKEYAALVTEGAKNGRINVVVDGETSGITMPEGKRYGLVEASLYLSYALNPALFASMDSDARRTMLFSLTGCQITGKKVIELLTSRGCDPVKIEQAAMKLGGGFPVAVEFAKEQARQSKADWKAITGETWGANKAGDWQAQVPPFDASQLKQVSTQIEALDSKISDSAIYFGNLQEQRKQHLQHMEGEAAREAQVEKLPSLRTKLESDQTELAKWEKQVTELEGRAGTGPREGLIHDLARAGYFLIGCVELDQFGAEPEFSEAKQALHAYEAQHGALDAEGDPEAAAKLPEAIKARDLMARSVENDRRDIASAEAAASQVATDTLIPEVKDAQLAQAQDALSALRQQRTTLEQQRLTLDRACEAGKVASANTEKAATYNKDVGQWLELADALSPDGIPATILGTALKPVNDHLRQSAESTGWMQVAVAADMAITAEGRAYALLAESEQWRVDAMLAEMIAQLSGLKLLVLDRADVLEPAARSELLGWLDGLATSGAIDTALVGITLKQPPTGLPDTMAAHWITQGGIESQAEPQTKAA